MASMAAARPPNGGRPSHRSLDWFEGPGPPDVCTGIILPIFEQARSKPSFQALFGKVARSICGFEAWSPEINCLLVLPPPYPKYYILARYFENRSRSRSHGHRVLPATQFCILIPRQPANTGYSPPRSPCTAVERPLSTLNLFLTRPFGDCRIEQQRGDLLQCFDSLHNFLVHHIVYYSPLLHLFTQSFCFSSPLVNLSCSAIVNVVSSGSVVNPWRNVLSLCAF